jgi:hypothetical protein
MQVSLGYGSALNSTGGSGGAGNPESNPPDNPIQQECIRSMRVAVRDLCAPARDQMGRQRQILG